MRLFFPAVHREIDWERGYVDLKQELQTIIPDAEAGKQFVDLLFKVFKKSGEESWVCIHVEVQSQWDADLPKRVFVYNSRLFLRYDRPIMSLAVLGDEHPYWRPQKYESELWGCEVSLKFPTVKLLEFRDKIEELKRSGNPFVYFVIAHLKTLETRKKPQQRLSYKEAISIEILQQELDPKLKRDLILFVDLLMVLPRELQNTYRESLLKEKEKNKMPLVAPLERYFREQGKEEGKAEGITQEAQTVLYDMLKYRFGDMPLSLEEKIRNLDNLTLLRKLRMQVLEISSLEEFDRLLQEPNQ